MYGQKPFCFAIIVTHIQIEVKEQSSNRIALVKGSASKNYPNAIHSQSGQV